VAAAHEQIHMREEFMHKLKYSLDFAADRVYRIEQYEWDVVDVSQ
jgi:hypothetical protein